MGVTYECKSVSIANFIDKTEAENEDFIQHSISKDHTYSCWVLCDGAGGAGVFSKEWAKHLAESVAPSPGAFSKNRQKWFLKTAKEFHEEVIEKADLSDLILQKKVYRDGSYATLCACWIDKEGDEIFYSSVGDSCIFFFEKENDRYSLKFLSSINKQDDIDAPPQLLNWNDEGKMEIPFSSEDVVGSFVVVMASDSLSRWIIMNLALLDYHGIESFFNADFLVSINSEKYVSLKEAIKLGHEFKSVDDLLTYVESISAHANYFKAEMKRLHANHEIEIDDYSLIFIKGDVSKPNAV